MKITITFDSGLVFATHEIADIDYAQNMLDRFDSFSVPSDDERVTELFDDLRTAAFRVQQEMKE